TTSQKAERHASEWRSTHASLRTGIRAMIFTSRLSALADQRALDHAQTKTAAPLRLVESLAPHTVEKRLERRTAGIGPHVVQAKQPVSAVGVEQRLIGWRQRLRQRALVGGEQRKNVLGPHGVVTRIVVSWSAIPDERFTNDRAGPMRHQRQQI